MASVQQITIIGNLGADPELRYTPGGKSVVDLRVATNRSWPDKSAPDGWAQETIWFRASAWDEQAERVAETYHKGDQVYIQGRLKPARAYLDRDGQPAAQHEIEAKVIYKMGRAERDADDSYQPARQPVGAAAAQSVDLDVDDIPF